MRCKFCFAGFKDVKATVLPKGHLPKEKALEVVKQIGEYGFSKISFAGGEPTLCPWLPELVSEAKSYGMTTMLITNGTKIDRKCFAGMKDILDWVVLSIDSLNSETNAKAGRKINSTWIPARHDYEQKIALIREHKFRFKINTVVHKYNFSESLCDFIEEVRPERWKVMRMLIINGQNDGSMQEMGISDSEFKLFTGNNRIENSGIATVIEDNNHMTGSYLMVDPAGRFFDNTSGAHRYSSPILHVGIEEALSQVNFSYEKFIGRNGMYDWD
jgi:radical S-adenosyl methionine domain-containing protein 2